VWHKTPNGKKTFWAKEFVVNQLPGNNVFTIPDNLDIKH